MTIKSKMTLKSHIRGYAKEEFIQLSLQGIMDRKVLHYMIEVTPKRFKMPSHHGHSVALRAA